VKAQERKAEDHCEAVRDIDSFTEQGTGKLKQENKKYKEDANKGQCRCTNEGIQESLPKRTCPYWT
jgi:hypothetical protein